MKSLSIKENPHWYTTWWGKASIAIFCSVIAGLILYRITEADKVFTDRFSDTQTIMILPSDDSTRYLNLDNVATLFPHPPYSLEAITLLLDAIPTYTPGHQGEGYTVDTIYYYDIPENKYIFDTKNHKRHEIKVGGRTFTVTLIGIKKLDIPDMVLPFQYTFGISEE